MKRCVAIFFCLFAILCQQVYAQVPTGPTSPTTPQKQQSPTDDELPQAFKTWEQANQPREAAEEARYSDLWSKTLLLLIIVLLFLFVGAWYMRRFGGLGNLRMKAGDTSSRIQILEKKVLSPKAVIYLLSIDGNKVALTETSAGIQVVQELARPVKPFSLEVPAAKVES